jgi:hypothetical protein
MRAKTAPVPATGKDFVSADVAGRTNHSVAKERHLSPITCTDAQGRFDTRRVNSRRYALTTVIDETMHAYGIGNEAKASCLAVQLVPYFDLQMGLTRARADYLGTLAVSTTRRGAPPGYWNGGRCRSRRHMRREGEARLRWPQGLLLASCR